MDERLVGISFAKRGERIARPLRLRRAGRKDAAVHRREMRREQDLPAKLHLHFRGVAVGEQAVGGEILVHRVELGFRLECLAGAADAGGGADGDRVGIDERQERLQREDRRRRIATGRGDCAGGADRIAMQLRDAVDEAAEQVRRLVLLIVPALIGGRVVQPEIGAEIDEGDVARQDIGGNRLGLAMRERGEDEIDSVERIRLKPFDGRPRIGERKVRMDIGKRRPGLAVAEQPDRIKCGVARAEPQQLRADEPRGSQDGDLDHGACICIAPHKYAMGLA